MKTEKDISPFMKKLGERIKSLRGRLGNGNKPQSMRVFAAKCGVGTSTIKKYESGDIPDFVLFLKKLQDNYRVSVDILISEKGGPFYDTSDEAEILGKTKKIMEAMLEHETLMIYIFAGLIKGDKIGMSRHLTSIFQNYPEVLELAESHIKVIKKGGFDLKL